MFFNYVQKAFVKRENGEIIRTGKCPIQHYRFSTPIFIEVLKVLHPTHVIVWGYQTHDILIAQLKQHKEVFRLNIEEYNTRLPEVNMDVVSERVQIDNDYEVSILRMHHPSQGFCTDKWYKIIQYFFDK